MTSDTNSIDLGELERRVRAMPEDLSALEDMLLDAAPELLRRARERDEWIKRYAEQNRHLDIGLAERVEKAEHEIATLRVLLKSGFAYVRDANRMMAADGDLDEEDEDGANEWMESVAAALGGGNIEEEREGETIDE